MKSLKEYIQESLSLDMKLNESSLLDIDDTNDDDLKLYITNWLYEHNSYGMTINPDCINININNGKVDVKYNGKDPLIINIGNGYSEKIPFKLGKFDGFISANWIKYLNCTNLPDECYGLEFNHVLKVNWKNSHVKINTYPFKSMRNNVDFCCSPGALKSMRNIKFEFTGENRNFNISELNPKMLDNITLINCKEIYVSGKLDMSEEEIQKIKGAEQIRHFGNIINIK